MAVLLNSLANTPYNIGAPQVLVDVTPKRGEHKIYDTANARINETWAVNGTSAVLRDFKPTLNPTGSTIYLPYNDDRITSVRLPNPPPPGVDFFLTANMSGCRLYIDTIAGSNDLIVYHANTHQHGAPAHNSPVNYQSVGASAVLAGLHQRAQADYAAAPYNLVLNNVAELPKVTYYLEGAAMEARKAAQGRFLTYHGTVAQPEFAGGVSVMGFYNAGWRFYYQTWGGVDYTRPSGTKAIAKDLFTFHWKSVHNRRTKGLSHSAFSDLSVVDYALIY
jgi:hypothetical protein